MRSRLPALVLAALLLLVPSLPASGSPPPLANPHLLTTLSQAQRAALSRQGFVVVGPGARATYQQFYDLYKNNLALGIPSFITSDAGLHMFHIMYDKTLLAMERELLVGKLQQLSSGLVSAAAYQYGATSDARIRQAARLDLGFASVGEKLLSPRARVSPLVAPQVRQELALIAAHRGFARSPLFGSPADYSQFAPRGHYNLSAPLRRYFQAMIWYGRMAFLLNGPNGALLTRQALLLVRSVTLVPHLYALWSAIFDPATAWVGHSDDLSLRDYAPLMVRVYGAHASVGALADNAKLARFIALANALPNPQIAGDVASSSAAAARETKGMRLFPQRFIPDAAIMQALIWDKVGTAQNRRLWPMGLDVAASLGSSRAVGLLDGPLHQNRYAHYAQRLSSLRRYYAALPAAAWRQNLYWRWLDALHAVWQGAPAGAPPFMTARPWTDRNLGSGLGSWAELRHDTLLYAKQPYGLGAGGGPPPFRVPYVEPVPAVWARLLDLTKAFKATLTKEGLLGKLKVLNGEDFSPYLNPPAPRGEKGYRAAVDSFIALLSLLQRVSQQELRGGTASHAEAQTLEQIGNELDLLDNFFQDNGIGKAVTPEQKQVPVIADVFTEPGSGQVLEEGVGDVLPLYAVVTLNGRRWLVRGGVFSYYEFHQPMSNRLSDEAWRSMRHRPPQPGWTSGYITP